MSEHANQWYSGHLLTLQLSTDKDYFQFVNNHQENHLNDSTKYGRKTKSEALLLLIKINCLVTLIGFNGGSSKALSWIEKAKPWFAA